MAEVLTVGTGRVFTIKFRAGPTHEPDYQKLGMAGGIDWGQGDVNKIERPSDLAYNQWEQIGTYQMSQDRATLTLTVYSIAARQSIMELVRLRCPFDIQIHHGACGESPMDFDGGWDRVRILEDALTTGYTTSDLGSLEGDGQDKVTEELPTSARSVYDVLPMTYFNVAQAEVGEIVVAVDVCDLATCGDCPGDIASDGCQKVFAVTNAKGSSPGVLPQVIITTDQFATAAIERWITTVALTEDATDGVCVGDYFVVSSANGEAFHYAPTADMIDEDETWTKVTTGVVAGSGPVAMWNYSPLLTFVAGLGGYIYRMYDPAAGVVVANAGALTTEDFNDISGYDAENVAAVGDAGAFVYAVDGKTFQLGAAPVGPTDLLSVAYRGKYEIWVGGDDGNFYVTTDYGNHWTTKASKGALAQIDAIVWASDSVGFAAGQTAAPAGVIIRTINGGYSWYVVPEGSGMTIPAADYFTSLAVCTKEVNKLFAGGLADNASDGILVMGKDV